MLTTIQVVRPNDADEQYNTGVEYELNRTFMLRAGYKFNYDAENVAAGVGMRLQVIGIQGSLDYGYNYFRWLSGTHSLSLELEM